MFRPSCVLIALLLAVTPAAAQPLGTFTWQLQPYCNVVTMNVTGVAGVYTLEGYDDQCGASTRAPLTGVATPNPDGTIGFGLTLVTSPGGRGVQVEARIALGGLSGPWTDSDGHAGTFAFNQKTGGSPRPAPVGGTVVPPVFGLRADGGFVAGGQEDVGTLPAEGPGTRMMWFPSKFAFRAGLVSGAQWDLGQVGQASVAFGQNSTASGAYSVAMGANVIASGGASVALGNDSKATQVGAFAVGMSNTAAGIGSVALGRQVLVTGMDAAGIGNLLDAAGNGSIVLGQNAGTTGGGHGSFVFGDQSNTTFLQAFAPHQFLARAIGGVKFYTSGNLGTGAWLPSGSSSWSGLSDVNSKENFRDLDGREVLAKLAAMPIREWNYKAQDAAIRHVGPTAQDFHAAFGLGEDPLRISTIDADGIALAGVSALARELAALRAAVEALGARLDRLDSRR